MASGYVLGISAFYHDSAACLLAGDVIVAAAQEERFTRVKGEKVSAQRVEVLSGGSGGDGF